MSDTEDDIEKRKQLNLERILLMLTNMEKRQEERMRSLEERFEQGITDIF